MPPLVIGLNRDGWKDPLNLYGGKAPGLKEAPAEVPSSAPNMRENMPRPPRPIPGPAAEPDDQDALIDTVIAEAAGEGDQGMAAVASVIRNRAGERGLSPSEVVKQKGQFEGYSAPGADAKKAMQDPQMRAKAKGIIDSVFSGELPDPTGGANLFHADYISPGWAKSATKTTQIGRQIFYREERGKADSPKPMPTYDELAEQPSAGGNPFDAVLKGEPVTKGGDPDGKGLARLLPKEPDYASGKGGVLNFVHPGQNKLNPAFESILVDTSKELGRDFTVISGFRAANHPVEAAKATPGEHSHGDASDISMKGMDEAQRADLVRRLQAKGAKRFITYSSSPDMLHVDMKDQTGTGKPWFMFDKTNRLLNKAPKWFQDVAADPGASQPAGTPGSEPSDSDRRSGSPIVVDGAFKPEDPMGLFRDQNPFAEVAQQDIDAQEQRKTEAADQSEQNRIRAFTEQHNDLVDETVAKLNADQPDRVEALPADEALARQQAWEAENRSGGVGGDTKRILKSGTIGLGQSLSSLADTLFRKLPGGEKFLEASDNIDKWAIGKPLDQKMAAADETARAGVTQQQLEADQKHWWSTDEKNHIGTFGPAWRDPRSYLRIVGESAPSTVVTMLPGGVMARGAYLRAIAGGASAREAAAIAARTATLTGAISEGTLGGADSARNVRDKIAAIPREQLLQTDAAQAMVKGGMAEDDAIKAITEDAATQAFLTAGVATGMFGGLGDRALAKIIAEGVGGGVAKRILAGGVRGFVGEGLLEEAPQGAAQQIAENAAVQTVDPNQSLTEGVGEQVAAGIAGGGATGMVLGGTGGAMRPAESHAMPSDTAGEQDVPAPAPAPTGPIGRAVRHAEDNITARAVAAPGAAHAPVSPLPQAEAAVDGRPEQGATVKVEADGVEPFMGRIDGYDGDEAIVIDSGTGEIYQVPLANVTQIAKSPEQLEREDPTDKGPVPIDDVIPALSNDPALEPLAPVASEVTTEPLPPRSEQQKATERLRGRPAPGQRVIVDDKAGGRFAATVGSYQAGDTEVVVTDDDGNDFQVPIGSLTVDKLTPKQIDAQDLKRDPPVEREIADAGPNSRRIMGKTVVLPDEDHAALYDLAKSRFIAKKTGGAAHTDLERVGVDEVTRLADRFKVSKVALTSMADDYRYRADRAAKEARSTLPVKMHTVNDTRLRQWQRDRAKEEGIPVTETAPASDMSDWWDLLLDDIGRRKVLADAGVKRNERSKWATFTPAIRKKLEAARPAEAEAPIQSPGSAIVTDVSPIPEADPSISGEVPATIAPKSRDNDPVLYHGTMEQFDKFDLAHAGKNSGAVNSGQGFFFTTDRKVAETYAQRKGVLGSKRGSVKEVRSGLKNPLVIEGRGRSYKDVEPELDLAIQQMKRKVPGYDKFDGIIIRDMDDAAGKGGQVKGGKTDADRRVSDVYFIPDPKDILPVDRAEPAAATDMRDAEKADGVAAATVDAAAHEAATSPQNDLPEPTLAQKEAGNYKVGRIRLGGLDISIENPAGSERKGVDASGKPWSVKMKSHYGYIRGTVGKDKDHIDVFVKPGTEALGNNDLVFVVDQKSGNGRFDEHKVMLGFDNLEQARAAYLANYTKGWDGIRAISGTSLSEFKDWLNTGNTKRPFTEESGPFGPILVGYEGKWREAALELERRQTGDAIGALNHPDVGPIDLVWGSAGTDESNGAGLAKLLAWHPEVLGDLQGFINRLRVDKERSTKRRIQLGDETGRAGVRLDYDGTAKTWLLTAYEGGSRRTEKSSRRLSDLWGDREASLTPPRADGTVASEPPEVQSEPTLPPTTVYHGTSNGGFTSFDTYGGKYGLFGSGGYFTEDPAIATEYTRKGKGKAPIVYAASLDVRNPLDMDAPADVDAWKRAFGDYLDEGPDGDRTFAGFTNEQMYREVEEGLANEMIPDYEGAETMQEGIRSMGHDAITHIGGGRHKASKGVKHRVWIVFDPEQVSDLRPMTDEPSLAANSGPSNPKRPDPKVTGSHNDLAEIVPPPRDGGTPIRTWASQLVTGMGRETGHEYLVAIDDDGSVLTYGTAGRPRETGYNDKLLAASMNDDRKLVVFHNHPSSSPPSVTDVAMAIFPGFHAIWANGHNGAEYRLQSTPEARERAVETGKRSSNDLSKLSNTLKLLLRREVDRFVSVIGPRVNDGTITPQQAERLHGFLPALIAERANIIDFQSSVGYDSSVIPKFDEKITEAAQSIARGFYNDGRREISGPWVRRPAQSLGHVAELETVGAGGGNLAAERSGSDGFSEGSARPDTAKERGWEEEVDRDFGRATATKDKIVDAVGDKLGGKFTDVQPHLLATVPLNYFPELAGGRIPAIDDYLLVKRKMDAYRGVKHDGAVKIINQWRSYIAKGIVGTDKGRAAQLADLMHETTLAGIDPSLTTDEEKAKGGYAALRKRYMALPPKGRELFNVVRDAYRQQAAETDQLLLDNVRKAQQIALDQAEQRYRAKLDEIAEKNLHPLDRRRAEEDAASAYKAETTKGRWAAKARMTKLRLSFENSRVPAPYFPLARFGRYFTVAKDIDGQVLHFSRHETDADRRAAVKQLETQMPNAKIASGAMEEGGEVRKAMDPRVLAEIETMLANSGVGDEIRDALYQRYLETMPDLSIRKRFIHRKGTAGYNRDAFRVFASTQFHGAHQMARLKYGLELQENVNQAVDQAQDQNDNTRDMTLVNELVKRDKWVRNPTGAAFTNWLTSIAYVWYMGLSPAAALVNASQTVMLGVPLLGAKFGIGKSSAALLQASRDFAVGMGDVRRGTLAREERAAMDAFYESGLIDRTQSHDLAAVGETGTKYNPIRAKVMNVISWGFHRVEVMNREITALAAYRLARDAGQSHLEAINTAHERTYAIHFDMSNSSRPRLLQSDFAKTALMFRSYQINMLYRLFRDTHQSLKGESKQVRREARMQLAGMVGMMSLLAGATGTVGYGLTMTALSLFGSLFGDDDDPMSIEDQFKAGVINTLGPELGGIVLNGVPGHYLGIDLTSRIGMPDLWFRSPYKDLQGREEWQYWVLNSLGAGVSLGGDLFEGFKVATDENDVAKGLQVAAPKAIRDLMKSWRYAWDGLQSRNGDQILPRSEISAHDLIAQALGFTPAKVAETYDRSSALRNAENKISDRRQRVINDFARAVEDGDEEARRDALAEIKKFNAVPAHRPLAITGDTLKRSMKTRARNKAKKQDGVLIQNEALGRQLRERLPETVYR